MATAMTHSVADLEAIKEGRSVKLNKPTLITSRDLVWKTGQWKFNQKLQRDKAKTPQGQAATYDLPTFQNRYDTIRGLAPAVRAFYHQGKFERQRCLIAWRTKVVKTKIVVEAKREHPQGTLVHAIGHAGTGVGSRIKGHLRMGGQWHRRSGHHEWCVHSADIESSTPPRKPMETAWPI
ncbi:hypothetical protein DM01DRAFT_1349094 [Hesseltinella vesiculosa]|uniref:Uncharacterized protein n=1 Tax=Hesseltinella vesiculosa TaxID=101127 RepID=A0A1X2G6I8_9FUNG|nr:hypothetical protein DM01DRAFT_1349094 [Hesseltinella vesiculosa]